MNTHGICLLATSSPFAYPISRSPFVVVLVYVLVFCLYGVIIIIINELFNYSNPSAEAAFQGAVL